MRRALAIAACLLLAGCWDASKLPPYNPFIYQAYSYPQAVYCQPWGEGGTRCNAGSW